MTLKLKALLEGYAWERKADGSLPTLADTTAAHARKMGEQYDYGMNRRPKFGKGSPHNDEPGFNRSSRFSDNIVNTNWDAVVDEFNNQIGYKVYAKRTPNFYQATITNTETGNEYSVTYQNRNWKWEAKIGGKLMRFDDNDKLIAKFREDNTGIDFDDENFSDPFIDESAKPDYIDLDKDGNKKEPMRKAARDAKKLKEGRNDHGVLDLVSAAEDMVQRLRSNMATNSVLQRAEKMGYLRAYDELLDILSEIGYQAEMSDI